MLFNGFSYKIDVSAFVCWLILWGIFIFCDRQDCIFAKVFGFGNIEFNLMSLLLRRVKLKWRLMGSILVLISRNCVSFLNCFSMRYLFAPNFISFLVKLWMVSIFWCIFDHGSWTKASKKHVLLKKTQGKRWVYESQSFEALSVWDQNFVFITSFDLQRISLFRFQLLSGPSYLPYHANTWKQWVEWKAFFELPFYHKAFVFHKSSFSLFLKTMKKICVVLVCVIAPTKALVS